MFRQAILAAFGAAIGLCGTASAEISDGVVRVGVLNDTSGIFQDTNGPGSIEAARMAAEDFAGGGRAIKVEIVQADHQNKADVASAIARRWLDIERVDAIVDVPNSAVGLALNALLRGTPMTLLASSTASSDLTGQYCSPNTVQWVNDTWATAHATASAMMKRGSKSWYFLTANFALGQAIESEATSFIVSQGGSVKGSVRHPFSTTDFSSFLLSAQASKADVIGLANSGTDTINALKQADEFGLREGGQSLVAFLIFINDVHSVGLKTAKGLLLTESYYWDMNEETRGFAKRFAARMGGKVPSANQAGVYSSTLAYLRAVAAAGSDNALVAVPEMKKAPIKDPLFGDLAVRADGRAVHPIYLFQVKGPEESKYPYDYYKLVDTIPAEQAFRPLAEGNCPLVKGEAK
ncbi:ABC transporter substrate-binding protein [Bradyrhizobium liaoningense]|uniref:ABC transporter substrate-binding protein n=1 Tax=Bradyrhizobium liaoningense TaxID=43992 RepID=UPI001BA62A97|nr:ABC transporter substrate-binding protein [Bradyrhizobium liaoningense]MBR0706971.1 ABC transporter substrate-binding protein [Bradyrhizobium liaoningense]